MNTDNQTVAKPLIRQAIETRFICPTNTRGGRYKASCARGSVTVHANHSLGIEENHIAAADALVAKFVKQDAENGRYATDPASNPWSKPRIVGCLKNYTYVHVYQG